MNKKRLLKVMLVSLSLVLLGISVLVVHIAQVTNPKAKPHYNIQLTRVDFLEPISDQQLEEVKVCIGALEGVGNMMYNSQFNNLIVAHDIARVSGSDIVSIITSSTQIKAKKFSLNETEILQNSKCPVVHQQSFLMTLAHHIQPYL